MKNKKIHIRIMEKWQFQVHPIPQPVEFQVLSTGSMLRNRKPLISANVAAALEAGYNKCAVLIFEYLDKAENPLIYPAGFQQWSFIECYRKWQVGWMQASVGR
jgi:hypothetical protein